jgi:AraC-like DNA-binding protein
MIGLGGKAFILASPSREPQPVEDIARYVGMSQSRLNEVFKDLFGAPVLTSITQWRLDMARDLLREGHMSIKEMASLLGYAHVGSLGLLRRTIGARSLQRMPASRYSDRRHF